MKRGIVLSIENKKAVVMTADGQFISIPHQSHMRIGEETAIQAETAAPNRKPKKIYWYTGAAAAILLFFIPFFYLTTAEAHPVVAYVSLDINPSIELGVDKQQRVQELRGLNEDGLAIVSRLSYKGKPLDTVAASIMSTVAAEHYLDNPVKEIVIASLLLDDNKPVKDLEKMVTAAVDQTVKETIKQIDAATNVTVLSVPTEVREEATANGVSSGKMAVYLLAKDEGYDIGLEQIKAQSLAEATQAAGGVKKIVEKGASKEKLKELAQKEKKSKKQAAASPAADKDQTPTAGTTSGKNTVKTETAKPAETKPQRPNRPTQTERPGWSNDDNNNKWNKPTRPVKPTSPTKPSGSDQDRWPNGDWSNNGSDWNKNSDKDDDRNESSKNNKTVNNSKKLENKSWQDDDDRDNDDGNNWDNDRGQDKGQDDDRNNDRKDDRNKNKRDDADDRSDRDR